MKIKVLLLASLLSISLIGVSTSVLAKEKHKTEKEEVTLIYSWDEAMSKRSDLPPGKYIPRLGGTVSLFANPGILLYILPDKLEKSSCYTKPLAMGCVVIHDKHDVYGLGNCDMTVMVPPAVPLELTKSDEAQIRADAELMIKVRVLGKYAPRVWDPDGYFWLYVKDITCLTEQSDRQRSETQKGTPAPPN